MDVDRLGNRQAFNTGEVFFLYFYQVNSMLYGIFFFVKWHFFVMITKVILNDWMHQYGAQANA